MEKRDGNVTNIFFPKPSLITVFDEKNIAQNNSYIVYTIIIASMTLLLNQNGIVAYLVKTEEIESLTYYLLFC